MRDRADNCVVVCSIENLDPMGVHTGDSITVAPAQTLTDVEYQAMRDDAFACLRRVGVETGGLQRAVRRRPARRPPDDHRDEPAGVALLGARVEGDGVPHRQDRGPPGRRLRAGRDRERHHGRHAGLLRADDRLRRDQDPSLRVREADRDRGQAGHEDAIGRRGDGDRAHVLRIPPEGAALAGAGPSRPERRPRRGGAGAARRRRAAGPGGGGQSRTDLRGRRGDPPGDRGRRAGRPHGHRSVVPHPDHLDHRGPSVGGRASCRRGRRCARLAHPGGLATPEAPRVLREPARLPVRDRRGRRACGPPRARRRPDLQDRRHLRGGVRGRHAVPLLDLRRRGRGAALVPAPGDHPRVGPEPHRAGDRVRLLLRPREPRVAGRGLRNGHDQLQPRDGVDRLRHLGPPLLRALERRGRAERHRGGAAGEHGDRAPRRRHRFARRPDATQARVGPPRVARARHPGLVDRPGRGPRALERAVPRARHRTAAGRDGEHRRGGAGHRRGDRLPGPHTSELRPGRPRDGDRLRRRRRVPGDEVRARPAWPGRAA